MKLLNKEKMAIIVLFSVFLLLMSSNINILIFYSASEKDESPIKTYSPVASNPTRSFIGTLNGRKYQMEYITEETMENMKNDIASREDDKEYNVHNNEHGTGLTPPTEDDLNNLIGKLFIKNLVSEAHNQAPSATYDFSSQIYFPIIGNQGGQGSCGAWAITYYAYGYLEAKDYGWDASSGNSDYLMSPAWTFNKVSTTNYGSWMTTNAQIMLDWGCATMTTMPYDDSDFYSWGDESAWREAPNHRIFDYYLLDFDEADPDATIDVIKSFISSEIPVTFAFDSYQYNNGFDDGNYILSSAEYDSTTYDHAQCIVGFDDSISDDGDVGAFRVANSWGTGFGDNGYYWLTYECLKEIGLVLTDFTIHLCVVADRIDYQPDLIATWAFNPAPTRMQDIITLGVGSYDTPLEYKLPWYEYDDGWLFPEFMACDISEFKPYYDADNDVLFYLDVGSSSTTGTISSFLVEKYVGGVLDDITPESPDVPKTTPGYVYNTFMDVDHDLKVILETPIKPEVGNTFAVNATVINKGIYDETGLNFYLYLDGGIVDSKSISTLLAGENDTIEYIWIPTESRMYNFTAYSPPVTGEIFKANNIKTNLVYAGMTIFFDDFESGLSNWDEISGLWHLTDNSSSWLDPYYSPIHSMWFGNESTGNYDTGKQEYGNLITVPIALPQADLINFEFYHWREGEGYGWDVSSVYISTDGINWEQLYYTDANIPPWEKVILDITKYKGNSSVQFNFYFDTYDNVANNYRGWLIDDVSIFVAGMYEHDLTVSIESPKYYKFGNTYVVNASIVNFGLYDESDVNLLLYLDNVIIGSLYIPILSSGSSQKIEYVWTPYEYRTYNFTAYAPPIPDEESLLNNIKEKLIIVHEIHLFNGLFINYTYRIYSESYISTFSYSDAYESLFHTDWDLDDGGIIYNMYWDVNAQTRVMKNSGGSGLQFGNEFYTPLWIFTDVLVGDIIPIAVDAEGDHIFNITGDLIYDLPGFGNVSVWILEDLTLPGGIAWYEKSTGILLYGIFYYYYGGAYNYTFNFVDTNAEINILEPPKNFTLFSNAEDPDDDGIFDLTWMEADGATNYTIYHYSKYITEINGSLTILADEVPYLTFPCSGYSDGTHYFTIVAHNQYGNTFSNCLQVDVLIPGTNGPDGIPGYNMYILIGIIGVISIILFKKEEKKFKN